MTKKDYELFANEINRQVNNPETFSQIVDVCVIVFSKDNPSFRSEKFIEACQTGKHIRKTIKNS